MKGLRGIALRFQRSRESAVRSLQEEVGRLQRRIEELEAGRSQVNGVLQSMAEGVLVVSPDEKLMLVNPSARRILGMADSVQPGAGFTEATRYPGLQEMTHRVLAEGREQLSELQLYSPQDRTLWVRAVPCEIPPQGRCALLVLHDITELKRLERVRQEFVANVSHELKTPLTTIQAAVETLLEGAMVDPSHGRSFLLAIQEESTRLRRLVDDLLSLAEVESKQVQPKKEPVPIRLFLEEQIERYRAEAQVQGIALRLECGEISRPVLADRRQLAQAVGNLLDNAVKYNRPGGTVLLKAAESGGRLTIEVQDTGIGIPPQDLPRIFERFYRVEKARSRETGGTGLGLSIVKHIAESHGGSVRAESEFGQGSCFLLTLPL